MRSISDVQKGTSELEFASWPHLLKTLATVDTNYWVFRGQADYAWGLQPSLGRVYDQILDTGPFKSVRLAEREAIRFFQLQASAEPGSTLDASDYLHTLFIMQHYGAPTRLLDWTRSPFVALYFAYADPEWKPHRSAALWFVDEMHLGQRYGNAQQFMPNHTNDVDGEVLLEENPFWYENQTLVAKAVADKALSWPFPLLPRMMDRRMLAQQAAFTFHGALDKETGRAIEKPWKPPMIKLEVKHQRRVIAGGNSAPILAGQIVRKIRLKPSWRENVLLALERMNISAATLFPGLDGTGRATKEHLASGQRLLQTVGNITITAPPSYVSGPPHPPSKLI